MVYLTNDMRQGQTPFDELRLSERFPPAMAYVPWQRLDEMYTPETALERGTLYPELDKPFMGCTVMSGQNGVCRRAAGSTANERRCQNG